MSGTITTPPAPRPTSEPTRHPADVNPDSRSAHAACHPASEHLENVTDVNATRHSTFPEVEPLATLAHVPMFVKSICVLLIALLRV